MTPQETANTPHRVGPTDPHLDLFGHPTGLYVCFATELWERFSFYGMKYLLVLYLVKYHLFSDADGYLVLGAYAGLVYALPVIGGLLADRYLGMRKAVVFGGILLSLGHILMAVEGDQAVAYAAGTVLPAAVTLADGTVLQAGTTLAEDVVNRDLGALKVFYLALALIVAGVGFLKPNISTIVGKLYPKGDARRDSGFTIFYMGINIGSFVATLLCGWLGEKYGWGYGFGAAGIGMIVGLFTFLWGQKYLYGHADPSDEERLTTKVAGVTKEWWIYILTLPALALLWLLVQNEPVVHLAQNSLLMVAIVGLILYAMMHGEKHKTDPIAYILAVVSVVLGLLWAFGLGDLWLGAMGISAALFVTYGFMRHSSKEYGQTVVLMILILSTIVFWALFEQSAASMTLFADRVVDRDVISSMLTSEDAWIFYASSAPFLLIGLFLAFQALRMNASLIAIVAGTVIAILVPLLSTVVAFAFAFLAFLHMRSGDDVSLHGHEKDWYGGALATLAISSLAVFGYLLYQGNVYANVTSPTEFVFQPTASNFGSLNAGFIILLAIPFARLWTWLDKKDADPSTPVKFGLGIIQAGLGFGALVLGAQFPDQAGKVGAIWLVLAYLLHTTGELCLSPVGLSAVTKLSIPRVVGVSMGTWFLATALSETIAARLSVLASVDTAAGETADVATALATYNELFVFLMWVGLGVGVFMLVISPLLKKGMHDVK